MDRNISDALCRKGYFRHLMSPNQRKFFNDFVDHPEKRSMALIVARRSGKTFSSLLFCLEYAMKHPGSIIRYMTVSKVQAKNICYPILYEIKDLIPADCFPLIMKSVDTLIFKNGSNIILGGTLPENIESCRGSRTTLLLLDEVCSFQASNFNYCLRSVLFPALTTTNGRIIYLTTPPVDVNHPFISDYLPELKADNALTVRTIYENDLLSAQQIEETKKMVGGEETEAWRREYLCELISDSSKKVVPEFNVASHTFSEDIHDLKKKEIGYLRGVISVDYGAVDDTAIIAGVYDSDAKTFYVTEERILKAPGLQEFVAAYQEIRNNLFPLCQGEFIEVLDAFAQLHQALRKDYNLCFQYPSKKAKPEASVAILRNGFLQDRVKISTKCKRVIAELNFGQWKETVSASTSKEFKRTEALGHLDSIAALCYALIKLDFGGSQTKSLLLGNNQNKPLTKRNPFANVK